MNREKKHKGNLNIGKNVVSLDTDIVYQAIQIEYVGTINTISLLPNNYILQKGAIKIIIVKMEKSDTIISDLFEYRGMAMITHCMLVDSDLNKHNLYINKSNLQLWNTLQAPDSSENNMDWAYFGEKWESIDFDGNNNKKNYLHRKTIYDKETKTYTTTKEIRKK